MFKVGIIGPESTGKSSLARYLAKRYKGTYVPEYARTYVEQKGTTDVSFDELCEIARYQIEQIKSYSEAVCQSEGRSASFAHYDMRWLKPLDEEILHEVGKHFKTIVTAEDGIIAGGLGSAVLEWMSDHGYTPHVIRLGVNDRFVEHGSTKELYHMLKLDKEGLLCELLSLEQEK